MPKKDKIAAFIIILFVVILVWRYKAKDKKRQGESSFNGGGKNNLSKNMRKLWAQHVFYTRQYIVDMFSGSPSATYTAERLTQNQTDIGNEFGKYYGQKAGKDLEEMLKVHILIAGDVLDAMKTRNDGKYKKATAMWHKNADDMAAFFNKADKKWAYAQMKSMLYEHLSLTSQEASSRLKQQWQNDIKAFDKVFDQALTMADGMTTVMKNKKPSSEQNYTDSEIVQKASAPRPTGNPIVDTALNI